MLSSGMLQHVALVRTDVRPKRWFLQELHGVTPQKTAIRVCFNHEEKWWEKLTLLVPLQRPDYSHLEAETKSFYETLCSLEYCKTNKIYKLCNPDSLT
jgi:hypothetical protein